VGMGQAQYSPAGLVSASRAERTQPPDRCRQVGGQGRRQQPKAGGRYLKSIGRGQAPPGQAKGGQVAQQSSTAPARVGPPARRGGPGALLQRAIHQRRRHHQPGGQGPVGRGQSASVVAADPAAKCTRSRHCRPAQPAAGRGRLSAGLRPFHRPRPRCQHRFAGAHLLARPHAHHGLRAEKILPRASPAEDAANALPGCSAVPAPPTW